jgi:8-oxo-dGTP diphosphatase
MTRDSGDAWVEGPGGIRRWGVYGAAGVLVFDPARGVLLQHRAEWSHFGGTWALPGGARHQGESAVDGGLREAAEEAAVPRDGVRLRSAIVVDLGFWSYTTVIVDVVRPFEAVVADPESIELRWVAVDDVEGLPLHPSFEEAWPTLRALLGERTTLVVDAANVVGSRPNGWWKDRAGATSALLTRIEDAAAGGFDLGDGVVRWPRVVVVVEGQASSVAETWTGDEAREALLPAVEVRVAERDGDQAVVDVVGELFASADADADAGAAAQAAAGTSVVTVVTADRELVERVEMLGATTLGPGSFLQLLDAAQG